MERFQKIRTVFTIHNIEYQGKMPDAFFQDVLGLNEYWFNVLHYGDCLNLMKGGYCDWRIRSLQYPRPTPMKSGTHILRTDCRTSCRSMDIRWTALLMGLIRICIIRQLIQKFFKAIKPAT